MKKLMIGLLFAAVAFFGGVKAYAGDNVSFKVHNSSKFIISAFQTNEGHGWSNNWLNGDQIDAGESTVLEFLHDGPCKIQLRVSWRTTDGGQEVGDPWNIDICKAQNVYIDNRGDVTYD
jgi:hypothetical protein